MKVRLSILLLGSLLGIASSCQKEDLTISQPQAQQTRTADGKGDTFPGCSPDNLRNPLDSVGLYHNRAVEYAEVQNPEANASEAVDLVNRYCVNTAGRGVPTEQVVISERSVRMLISDSTTNFANTVARSSYSASSKQYLQSLNELVKQKASTPDFCAFKDAIVAFEADVLQDGALQGEDRAVVLRACSIARYSAYHWISLYSETTGGIKDPVGQKKFWQWAVVIGCDVAGAIFGEVAGAAAASAAANAIVKD